MGAKNRIVVLKLGKRHGDRKKGKPGEGNSLQRCTLKEDHWKKEQQEKVTRKDHKLQCMGKLKILVAEREPCASWEATYFQGQANWQHPSF